MGIPLLLHKLLSFSVIIFINFSFFILLFSFYTYGLIAFNICSLSTMLKGNKIIS